MIFYSSRLWRKSARFQLMRQNRLRSIITMEIDKWYFREKPYFWSDRYEDMVGISDSESTGFTIVKEVDE